MTTDTQVGETDTVPQKYTWAVSIHFKCLPLVRAAAVLMWLKEVGENQKNANEILILGKSMSAMLIPDQAYL